MSPEDLLNAAEEGDVEVLRKCVASNKPKEYYLTQREIEEKKRDFLHLAVENNKLDFVREAVQSLPAETIQLVIERAINEKGSNHLHTAAAIGNVEIVKVILDFYKGQPLPPEERRPWLARDEDGDTPCHLGIWFRHQDCGLEIWRMDSQLLSDTKLKDGTPLLPLLVLHGLHNWALEMLSSSFKFSCTDTNGCTALHYIPCCTDEEVFRQLLKRDPNIIKHKSEDGKSVLHYWAEKNKLWPFECLLRSADILPDVRKIFVELMSAKDNKGFNPLHTLAALDETSSTQNEVEIAKFLVENYKQEIASSSQQVPLGDLLPWLMEDKKGRTPLFHAIHHKKEEFAVYILEVDNNAIKRTPNCLHLAMEKGCHQVSKQILDIVDAHAWDWSDLLTVKQRVKALHLAPLCPRDLFDRLLSQHSEVLEEANKDGATVLHEWVKLGQVWALEYLMNHRRSQFVRLIGKRDVNLNYPLHVAASATSTHHEAAYRIAQLLVEAHKQENPSWRYESYFSSLPWFSLNGAVYGPMHLAMINQHENLALYFLSLLNHPISKLLDYCTPAHKTLFLAVENNCFQVARRILAELGEQSWSTYITNSSNGQTIFHLLPHCKDQEDVRWLIENAPTMVVTKADVSGRTALHEASSKGADWLIQVILEKHPSAFDKTPLAWVEACEQKHISAVGAFINHNPGKFRDLCIEHANSPLHYDLKLSNLTDCEQFLNLPGMKDLINLQGDGGATPLHKAVRNKDIYMTETLLNMNKILDDIKDDDNITAADLLAHICGEERKWDQMCKRNGFDPWIKTAFFKRKTNLIDARTALFVVAALLATITFTAGFTLPGGFEQDNGHAVLAKKPVFLVFLVSDALAMCSSILVLMCLIWSLFFESNNDSLILIDSSMVLLLIALFFTLLAFMTGVYVVIAPKKLWPAIVILVICSLIIMCLIGFSALNKLLNNVLSFFRKRRPHQDFELYNISSGPALLHLSVSGAIKDLSPLPVLPADTPTLVCASFVNMHIPLPLGSRNDQLSQFVVL